MQDNPPGVMESRVSDAAATGKPEKSAIVARELLRWEVMPIFELVEEIIFPPSRQASPAGFWPSAEICLQKEFWRPTGRGSFPGMLIRNRLFGGHRTRALFFFLLKLRFRAA